MSCGRLAAWSRPSIRRSLFPWASWIPETRPVSKKSRRPLCLKLRITLYSVTRPVTGVKESTSRFYCGNQCCGRHLIAQNLAHSSKLLFELMGNSRRASISKRSRPNRPVATLGIAHELSQAGEHLYSQAPGNLEAQRPSFTGDRDRDRPGVGVAFDYVKGRTGDQPRALEETQKAAFVVLGKFVLHRTHRSAARWAVATGGRPA